MPTENSCPGHEVRRASFFAEARTSGTGRVQSNLYPHIPMEEFFQQLTNGLAVGSIYTLIALGYTMVYGIMKLINFAHSELSSKIGRASCRERV